MDWHDYERVPRLGDFDEELQNQRQEEDDEDLDELIEDDE
jgi:hypothetical protein